jgi:putative transposase
MNSARSRYHGHRFPPEIIGYAVWVYHRFCLSFRDVEDLLAERGIIVSYEAIRQWCSKFGPDYARRLKKKQGRLGDTWYLDELFIRINGQQQYLWRAVDQDGDVIDILLQSRRDQRAAERFLRRLLRGQGKQPFRIITDKLKSYAAAGRTILPGVTHDTQQSGRNFASAHSDVRTTNALIQITPTSSTLSITPRCRPESVCIARHLLRSTHHRLLRSRSFEVWRTVTAAWRFRIPVSNQPKLVRIA